jgi:type IV pilus assembly protein PilA
MNKKLNNKGFSLVELIIVIAIMAILVGVLAPQFIKYVEQSRRSTDIQSATEIREAILADIADGVNPGTSGGAFDGSTVKATSITEVPKIVSNASGVTKGGTFTVDFDVTAGTCTVKAGSYELTTAAGASEYKAAASN